MKKTKHQYFDATNALINPLLFHMITQWLGLYWTIQLSSYEKCLHSDDLKAHEDS